MIGVIPKILLQNMDKWKYENDKMVAIGTVSKEIQDAIDSQNTKQLGEEVDTLKSLDNKDDDNLFHIAKTDKDKYVIYIGLNVTGAEHLAIDGGEDPKDFHVTLLYGYYHPVSDVEDTAMRIQSCREKAVKYLPDTLKLDKIGRFEASSSSDGKDVIYARVAPGQLEKAHNILLKELNDRGLKVQPTFDEYNPHMTLAYIDQDEEVELKDIDETVSIINLTEGFETDEASSKENENTFKIAKTDDDKRLVFGWALVAKDKDGNVIKDHQNDIVDEDDLEEGAYEYVLNFRDSGEEHLPGLRKKARMVESCVFTEEKQKALGIPEGIVPTGWWIGFYVDDDDAWEKIKNGTYKMFSIEGKAIRVPVDLQERVIDEWNKQKHSKDDLTKSDNVAKSFADILKFNPYHGKDGRFSSASGANSFSAAQWQITSYADKKRAFEERIAGAAGESSSEPSRLSYADLVQQAKDMGIKGARVGMRRETLEQKIEDAKNGIVRPSQKKTLSDAVKEAKQRDLDRFYGKGNTTQTSNKYFEFKRVLDDDNCIIVTNNIKTIKGNPVLVTGNNQAVYLKDWQYREVHNYNNGIDAYAVKLNRNYFKPYTFRFEFDDFHFDKNNTFDDMMATAKEQDKVNMKFAHGHMGIYKSIDEATFKGVAKSFADILKFNPYHDRLGRFTSGGGFMASGYTGDKNRQAVTFSADPNTKAGALAIERARGHHP